MPINAQKIRQDFPALQQKINNKPILYLDNACVTLRPQKVIDAINEYYLLYPGCHRRTNHKFGQKTTEKYSQAREKIKKFINAKSPSEIIFVRNTTEAINLLSNTLDLKKTDTILTTEMEHNSNFIPWQILSNKNKLNHKIIPLNEDSTFNMEIFKKMMDEKVRLVSVFHTSNVTGYTLPIEEISKIAKEYGAFLLLDGAQSIAHQKIDVQKLDIDFFVFSLHKILGPSGVGICYGKQALLEELPQFLTGGETITDAFIHSFIPAGLPDKFEAGLQNYAGAIGAKAAIEYLEEIGDSNIREQEYLLNCMLTEELLNLPDITLLGPKEPKLRGNIFNFFIKGMNSLTLAQLLDETNNIMSRAGMHCAHPWFNAHKIPASIRISTYFYNTQEEIKTFVKTLEKIIRHFK